MSQSIQTLQRLRDLRARPERDMAIARLVSQASADAHRLERKLGEMIALWEKHVPRALAAQTALVGLSRGVLQVAADSSAAMYELDRLLRGGLLQALRSEYRGGLVRIRLRLAEPPRPGQDPRRARTRNAGGQADAAKPATQAGRAKMMKMKAADQAKGTNQARQTDKVQRTSRAKQAKPFDRAQASKRSPQTDHGGSNPPLPSSSPSSSSSSSSSSRRRRPRGSIDDRG